MEDHTQATAQVQPPDKAKIRRLWTVALYLGIITALEFAVAFLVGYQYHTLKVWIFVGMTIVKAAYIVGEFMHLKYEVKALMWSIVLPMVFVLWFVVSMINEGRAIFESVGP